MNSRALFREPHRAADRMPNAWHGAQAKDQRTHEAHEGNVCRSEQEQPGKLQGGAWQGRHVVGLLGPKTHKNCAKVGERMQGVNTQPLHRRPHLAADRRSNAWHGAQPKDQRTNEALQRGRRMPLRARTNRQAAEWSLARPTCGGQEPFVPQKNVQEWEHKWEHA